MKKRIHDLHIFLFLALKKALDHYDYFKDNRVFSLVAEFKPYAKKYKEVKYFTEHRINIWLRDNGQEEIAKNQKLLSSVYFEKLKGMVDELLIELREYRKKNRISL